MKKLFYTLLTVFLIQYSYAQKGEGNRIDTAINQVKIKVDSIESEIRFKTLVNENGYLLGDENKMIDFVSALYFNKNGRILKSKMIFSFPGEYGFYCRYYNEKGVAIHALYSCSSETNNSTFASRYLNADKSLLYIDFLKLDKGWGDIGYEHICFSGKSNIPMLQENGVSYDKVFDQKDLMNEFKRLYFDIDSLYMPSKVTPVKFILPRKGDQTYITHNSVPIHKDTSMIYAPVIELNVGAKVQVLDIDENWYKIKYTKWEGMEAVETIGCVEQKFLAHVEIKQ